jgi:hypothetical protein
MRRLLTLYYLATPGFAALDLAFGLNVRTVFLDHSPWRFAYYLGVLGCGLVAWRKPEAGPLVGMVEGGVSLALLIIGIYAPILGAAETLEAGAAMSPVLTPRGLVNAVLSGAGFAAGFYGNQAALIARSGR